VNPLDLVAIGILLIAVILGARSGALPQLIGLPIVPDFVREEIEGSRRHYRDRERCVFCDIIRQEVASGRRVIHENADVIAVVQAGRPPCPMCGEPLEPTGHFCARRNGKAN